jgi:hypothetical protein
VRSTNCICICKKIHSLILLQFCSSIVVHIEGLIFSCFYYHICPSSFDRIVTNKIYFFIPSYNWIHFISIHFPLITFDSTFKYCKYSMYCIVQLNTHYFMVGGLDIVFFDYPTLFVALVAIQSSINSHAVEGLCFFHVVEPMPICLKLNV